MSTSTPTTRIAVDARMVRITGIGRYTAELIANLRSLKQDVTALVAPKDVAWWREHYPTSPYLEAPEQIYSWSEQLVLPARLTRGGFDLVHFTNFNVPLGYRGAFVLTLHDLTPLSFSGERRRDWVSKQAYRRVLVSAIARAGRIIVPSAQVRGQLAALVGPRFLSKTVVVHHGLGQEFRTSPTDPATRAEVLRRIGVDKPFALYVGNFRSHKNVTTLIQAFAALHDEEPTSQLVLVGAANAAQQAALTSVVESHKLRRAVVLAGELPDSELIAVYDAARLLVLPSFVEGFGLPALEAAARGVPVLASETTPVREFLGRAALSFNPRNVTQLADLLSVAWYDPTLRERLSNSGRTAARTRTWRTVAEETLEVYRSVVPSTVRK